MLRLSVLALATGSVALIAPAHASPTDTATVGNVGSHLVYDASCEEVVAAYEAIPSTSTEQALLILHSITFQHGYALAKGITADEAWDEIMARCFQDLSQPFAGFPR
jgi:hypothetical protein